VALTRAVTVVVAGLVGALLGAGRLAADPLAGPDPDNLACPDFDAHARLDIGADLKVFYPNGATEVACIDALPSVRLEPFRDGLCVVRDRSDRIIAEGYFTHGERSGDWAERNGSRVRQRIVDRDSTVLECSSDSCALLDLGHLQSETLHGIWPRGAMTCVVGTIEYGVKNVGVMVANATGVPGSHLYKVPLARRILVVPLGEQGSGEFLELMEHYAFRPSTPGRIRYR